MFNSLLGVGQQSDTNVNDNTIEAAIRLMNKIGFYIESKTNEGSSKERAEKLGKPINEIFERFGALEAFEEQDSRNRASNRIKILIKNLFDNKKSGWAKTKEEKKIQTKAEVEKAVIKQDADKRQVA